MFDNTEYPSTIDHELQISEEPEENKIDWKSIIEEHESSMRLGPEEIELDGFDETYVPAQDDSALNAFQINVQDVETHFSKDKQGLKSVCICGHGISRHMDFGSGFPFCQVARGYCPCNTPKPFIKVQDTRTFMFTTKGWGSGHALVLGIRAYELKGNKVQLINKPHCMRCGVTDVLLIPTPIDSTGRPSTYSQALNVIACEECLLYARSK